MKSRNKFLLLSLLSLFSFVSFCAAQGNTSKEFDATVALENTDLSNGVEYIEQHIIRNEQHKFFLTQAFESGTVTYAGQTYIDIPLKYNVYDDVLLVRIKNTGGESVFQLHQEDVQGFRLGDHRFTKFHARDRDKSGFYESLLRTSEVELLKKYLKKQRKHLDKNFTYYEFESDNPEYFLKKEEIFHEIKSRRDIVRIFPEKERMIRQYYRSGKPLLNSDLEQFLVNLIKTVSDSQPTKNTAD